MSMNDELRLIVACKEGQISFVKQFVEGKCDLNHKDWKGKTALHWACEYGHPDIVEFLIEKGANLEENWNGNTPLAMACKNRHWDTICCLMNSGCSVTDVNEDGESLLMLVIKKGQVSQVSLAKQVIQRKCDLNYKNEHWKGRTALHYACQYNHADIVLLLVKEGANLEVEDRNGVTPLAVACSYSH